MSAVLRYLFRRIVLTIPVLLGVATLVFSLIHLVPGDPAQAMLGEGASPQDVAELRSDLGLDRPLLTQYGVFLRRAVTGDLGVSFRTGQPVVTMIAERVPATVELALAAMAVAIVDRVAARHRRRRLAGQRDRLRRDDVCAGRHLDSEFLAGPDARHPVFAWSSDGCRCLGAGTPAHLVLPAISLGLALAAILARMTRASLLDELGELYVRAARARGVSRSAAVVGHALRNSLIPLVTILALQFGAVLTGAVITETIFAWPGIGRLLIQSISFRDYPMVQGCILLIAVHLCDRQPGDRRPVRRPRSADSARVTLRLRSGQARAGIGDRRGRRARRDLRAVVVAVGRVDAGSGAPVVRTELAALVRSRRARTRHPGARAARRARVVAGRLRRRRRVVGGRDSRWARCRATTAGGSIK